MNGSFRQGRLPFLCFRVTARHHDEESPESNSSKRNIAGYCSCCFSSVGGEMTKERARSRVMDVYYSQIFEEMLGLLLNISRLHNMI